MRKKLFRVFITSDDITSGVSKTRLLSNNEEDPSYSSLLYLSLVESNMCI